MQEPALGWRKTEELCSQAQTSRKAKHSQHVVRGEGLQDNSLL